MKAIGIFCISLIFCAFTTTVHAQTANYSKRMIQSQGRTWTEGKSWDYVSGLVSEAVLKAAEQYPDETWAQDAYRWAKTFADNSIGKSGMFYDNGEMNKFKKGSIDEIASGKVFFELYRHELQTGNQTDADKYKACAETLYKYFTTEYSRIQDGDAAGGYWHKNSYPNQMWLDGLFMGAAFSAEYLAEFDAQNIEGWRDVTRQFQIIHRHTFDKEKKLNYHGWSAVPTDANSFWTRTVLTENRSEGGENYGCSAEFWGRGMGWYFAALVDVIEYMEQAMTGSQENAPFAEGRLSAEGRFSAEGRLSAKGRLSAEENAALMECHDALKEILNDVAAGLAARQDAETGAWYQLLQYDGTFYQKSGSTKKYNYLEASASCMFTYGYLKALRLGLIPAEDYDAVAEKAYSGLISTFITESASSNASEAQININKICRSAGLGPANKPERDGSAYYYLFGSDASSIVSNEGKGIGSFILASLEYERRETLSSGINSVYDESVSSKKDAISGNYTISGQKAGRNHRGIVISNGRKILNQ